MVRIDPARSREDDVGNRGTTKEHPMHPVRKILVAVKNPDRRRHAVVDKAISLAKSLGASIEFYHAISDPVFMEIQPLTGNSLAEIRREALRLRQQRLDKLVERACAKGVESGATVEWDFPPHEAIVRRAVRCRADLIVAECHEGARRKWLMRLTDWELLRASPVPVLLLKNSKPWRRNTVLAAVDPSHAHSKPSRLDSIIVEKGKQLTSALEGQFHLMHAAHPSAFGITLGDPSIDAATLAATYDQQKAKARKEFAEFAESVRVPRKRRHVIESDPAAAIATVAREVRADVVVMGAVSRSGLRRLLIGNTAERVLESLPCDVLVVKPAHFEKLVSRTSRGMHVVAPSPLLPMPM
jgi:universal stress protein E